MRKRHIGARNPEVATAYKFFRGKMGQVGQDAIVSLALAKAEVWAKRGDCTWTWDNDPDGWPKGGVCSCGCGKPIDTCESCTLYDSRGAVLASLHGIWDADDYYRRIVEAELALEAMP